jgi:hypothetical protein
MNGLREFTENSSLCPGNRGWTWPREGRRGFAAAALIKAVRHSVGGAHGCIGESSSIGKIIISGCSTPLQAEQTRAEASLGQLLPTRRPRSSKSPGCTFRVQVVAISLPLATTAGKHCTSIDRLPYGNHRLIYEFRAPFRVSVGL